MINIENSCCFTGYRPEKFPFPFESDCLEQREFLRRLNLAISEKIEKGCTVFYCGMAQGFDIVAGEQVSVFKMANKNIRLIGVVPFRNMEKSWRGDWKKRYTELLAECDEVVVLNETYGKWVFDQRNRYMVDRSRHVLTYYDGKKGGTGNTVKYALKNGREVFNIYDTDPMAGIMERFNCVAYLYPPENI